MRILVYAEVSPNLIDGSSVWLASLIETLGCSEELSLTVLLAAEMKRPLVLGHLVDHPRVRFIDPSGFRGKSWFERLLPGSSQNKLSPDQAAGAIEALDREQRQDLFIVRGPGIFEGPHILEAVAERPAVAARTWAYLVDPRAYEKPQRLAKLKRVFNSCRRFMCQTENARDFLIGLLGDHAGDRLVLLPPMIPAVKPADGRLTDPMVPRLGYSGKFSPPYRILEMLSAFRMIRESFPQAEFHLVGDKFHNAPRVEGFEERVREAFEDNAGVVWHGGVTRSRTNELMAQVDVASSWRDDTFDDNLELSTKVLEYASLGLPVLMNPSDVQVRVFGEDYPAYIRTEDEFVDRFLEIVSSKERYREISQRVRSVAAHFTFPAVARLILPLLLEECDQTEDPTPTPSSWTCDDFDLPKLPGAEFNLGLVGSFNTSGATDCTASLGEEQLRLALGILKRLREEDRRYTLHIKGRRRMGGVDFDRIVSEMAPTHRNAVVFDSPGDDLPAWFCAIGFIIFPSWVEEERRAVAGGMAAGSIPVVQKLSGAQSLVPERYLFSSVEEAAGMIRRFRTPETYLSECERAKTDARRLC